MKTRTVEVPEEILHLLEASRFGEREEAERVRMALAIYLFQQGDISIGKAAQLAGEGRMDFEWLLSRMGIPTFRYDVADYQEDLRTIAKFRHKQQS